MNRQFRRKQNKMSQNNTAPKNQEELGMLKNQLRNIQGQYVNSYTNVFNNVVNSMLQGQTTLSTSEEIINAAMDLTEKIRIAADEYAAKLSKEAKVPSSLLQRIKELEGEPQTDIVKPDLKVIDG